MTTYRWIWRSLPMATALVAGAASFASAQWNDRGNRNELFEWTGSVDREVQIVMRGSRVWTNDIGWTEPGNYNARAMSYLPQQNGRVWVQVVNGRGDVDVIQQPNAQNGYSTTVRIRDPRSGSDRYRVVAYYEGYGSSNGDVYGYPGNDRGRDRDMDDRRRGRDGDDDDRGRGRGRDNNGGYGDGGYGNGGYGNGGYGNAGYGNSVLHWTGNVDDVLEIRMQNGRLDYRTLRGQQPTGIRVNDVGSQMPRSDATLSVVQHSGRGSVSVVQQPSNWNGYTTVIRINDPQGGYGFYDFDLVWR